MRIRGERECRQCGTRWSYYETGAVTCPDCGSPVSVGVGERAEHTDAPAEFDLTPVRARVDETPLREVAEAAADRAADYLRATGFVHAGDLQPLSETYLAAAELRQLGTELAGGLRVDDPVELYFLSLLGGADEGDRPDPDEVPDAVRGARGRAVAAAVDAVQSDLRRVLADPEPRVSQVLSSVTTHRKRIEALDGDVPPREAERLVRAVRDLLAYLRENDETALARAEDRLREELG
jgi:uncharacterized Zn finger protein (UPF0148 family)